MCSNDRHTRQISIQHAGNYNSKVTEGWQPLKTPLMFFLSLPLSCSRVGEVPEYVQDSPASVLTSILFYPHMKARVQFPSHLACSWPRVGVSRHTASNLTGDLLGSQTSQVRDGAGIFMDFNLLKPWHWLVRCG